MAWPGEKNHRKEDCNQKHFTVLHGELSTNQLSWLKPQTTYFDTGQTIVAACKSHRKSGLIDEPIKAKETTDVKHLLPVEGKKRHSHSDRIRRCARRR